MPPAPVTLEEIATRSTPRIGALDREEKAPKPGSRNSTPPEVPCGSESTRSTRCSKTRRSQHLGIAQYVPNAECRHIRLGRPAGQRLFAHAKQDGGAGPPEVRRADLRGACRVSDLPRTKIGDLRQAKDRLKGPLTVSQATRVCRQRSSQSRASASLLRRADARALRHFPR